MATDEPHLLERVGTILYGEWWHRAIAEDLEVTPKTVRRWASGASHPPPDLPTQLYRLLHQRQMVIHELMLEFEPRVEVGVVRRHRDPFGRPE